MWSLPKRMKDMNHFTQSIAARHASLPSKPRLFLINGAWTRGFRKLKSACWRLKKSSVTIQTALHFQTSIRLKTLHKPNSALADNQHRARRVADHFMAGAPEHQFGN